MLVDLTVRKDAERNAVEGVRRLQSIGHLPEDFDWRTLFAGNPAYHEGTGIYRNPEDDVNFDYYAFEEFDSQPMEWCYGVADNVEQVLEHNKELVDSPEKYVLTYGRVFQDRANAGKRDGWRWSKWGEYIGSHNPMCEYLDDEDFGPDFQGYVIVYSIYRVVDKNDRK